MGILYFMVKMKYDALKLALFCRNSFKNILCLTQSRGIDSSEHFSGMKDIQIDKHKKRKSLLLECHCMKWHVRKTS